MDAYRIGVQIAMSSNASSVLGVIQKDLFGFKRAVDLTSGGLNAMKIAAVGAMSALSGGVALGALWKLVEHGKKLNSELERTRQLGGDFAANLPQARAAAIATSINVPTSLPSEDAKAQREIGTQLGKPKEAAEILDKVAKAAYVVSHYTGEATEDIIKNLTKVADIRGQIFSVGSDGKEKVDASKLHAEVEAAAKGLILGGGFIKSSDLLRMAIQGGVPAKTMTPEAFYTDMVEMSVSQGASRTGTALTSLFAQMAGGKMTKSVAEEMTRMGILGQSEYAIGRGGAITTTPEASQRLGGMATDPVKFVNDVLMPALSQRGIVGQEALLEVFKLFGRQTTQRFISELISNNPQFARAREIAGGIGSSEQQYNDLLKKDLGTNIKAFGAAWSGLMEVLGEAGIPVAIDILRSLTGTLNDLKAWAATHQDTVKVIIEVAGALAVLAVAVGAFAVGTAAISALSVLTGPIGLAVVAVGLIALAAAVKRFKASGNDNTPTGIMAAAVPAARPPEEPSMPWIEVVKHKLADFATQFPFLLADTILNVGTEIGHAARNLFDEAARQVVDALGQVANAIVEWARGIPSAVGSALGDALGSIGHATGLIPDTAAAEAARTPGTLPQHGAPGGRGSGTPSSNSRSYAPPASSTPAGRRQYGDVTLDGERVGRWLDRWHARSMSGPQFAALGFDPTMSPGYTGSGAG